MGPGEATYKILNPSQHGALEAIVFDWDGVLVDSLSVIHQCYYDLVYAMGLEESVDPHAPPTRSARASFPEIFGPRSQEAQAIFYENFEKKHLDLLKPMEGAEDLLRFLCQEKIPLFVVSNKKGSVLRKELDYLSWTRYFDAVVGAGDCAEDKPSPLPVYEVLSRAFLKPSKNTWFVGDSLVDVHCAKKSGCTPIFVKGRDCDLPDEVVSDAFAVLFSCEGLKKIVSRNRIKV